jgi:hypothetical protein
MRFSVRPRTDLFGLRGTRLDAEAFDPELLEAEERLVSRGAQALRTLAAPAAVASFPGEDEAENYIDISSIDTRDGLLIATEYLVQDLPSRAKHRVHHLDTLVSNVRPQRGAIALVPSDADGYVASSGFTCLRAFASGDARILFAWMRSTSVRNQLTRRSRNSMYPAVGQEDVFDILVPRFTDQLRTAVSSLVEQSEVAREQMLREFAQQRSRLEEFLAPYGAPPSPLHGRRGSAEVTVVPHSTCFGVGSTNRVDVEFHRSDFAEFEDRAVTLGATRRLGDMYSLGAGPGRQPGDGTVGVVKQAVLTNLGINWSAVEHEVDLDDHRTVLSGGEILIASAAHEVYYVGRKVDVVRTIPSECVVNQVVPELIVARPKSEHVQQRLNSYVAAFLRHDAGLHQVQRCIRGLRGGHIYGFDLGAHVVVPIPSDDWLAKFEGHSRAGEEARRCAIDRVTTAVALLDDAVASETF